MAAAAPPIIEINDCLPNFIEAGNVNPWKRYLFYMLGYGDTYHDFSKSRLSNNGSEKERIVGIVNKVGSLPPYILKVIGTIDSEFKWEENYFNIIKTYIDTKKRITFENAMFLTFTKHAGSLLVQAMNAAYPAANPKYGDEFKNYLKQTFQLTETQNIDIFSLPSKLSEYNGLGTEAKPITSPILECIVPADVYKEPSMGYFTNFILEIYKDYKVGKDDKDNSGKLKFVEDTASFPRRLVNHANFIKIVTAQTKWDPAGLSSFTNENNDERKGKQYAAPSFIARDTFNPANVPFKNDVFFKSEEVNKEIKDTLEIDSKSFNITTVSGPSVNHLLMHMILNSENLGVDTVIRNKLYDVFKPITLAKSVSNHNLDINIPNKNDDKIKNLRKYTASKRSGDYENIHSAMNAGAVMFTGDEPAFLYGVMNQCPIIYHTVTDAEHTFRFYIPPPKSPQIANRNRLEKLFRDYVYEANDLNNIFGMSVREYNKLFNDIDKKLKHDKLAVYEDEMLGECLKCVLVNNLVSLAQKGQLIETIYDIHETLKNIGFPVSDQIKQLEGMLKGLKSYDVTKIEEFTAAMVEFEKAINDEKLIYDAKLNSARDKIESVRDYLPPRYEEDAGTQVLNFFDIFKELKQNEIGQTVFTSKAGTGQKSFMFKKTRLIPEIFATINIAFRKLGPMIKRIRDSKTRAIRIGGGYDIEGRIISEIQSILVDINCPKVIVDLFTSAGVPEKDAIKRTYNYDAVETYGVIMELVKKTETGLATASTKKTSTGKVKGQRGGMFSTLTRRVPRHLQGISKGVSRPAIQPLLQTLPTTGPLNTRGTLINTVRTLPMTRRNRPQQLPFSPQESIILKPSVEIDHTTIFNEVKRVAEESNSTPFGLTSDELAASIAYRSLLVDKLYNLFQSVSQKNSNEETTNRTQITLSIPEEVLYNARDKEVLMRGGGVEDDIENEYLLYLQNEFIHPFWHKYFVRIKDDPEFIDTVYSESFVSDYMNMLDAIIETPLTLFQTGNRKLMKAEIDRAITIQENFIIYITNRHGNKKGIQFKKATGGVKKEDMNNLFQSIKDGFAPREDKFQNIAKCLTYFNSIFTFKDLKTIPSTSTTKYSLSSGEIQNEALLKEKIEQIFCEGPVSVGEANYKIAQNNYVHIYFKQYFDLMYDKKQDEPLQDGAVEEALAVERAEQAEQAEQPKQPKQGFLGWLGLGSGRNTRRRRPVKKRPSKRRAPKRAHKQSSKARK